jgi:hypothetical protein
MQEETEAACVSVSDPRAMPCSPAKPRTHELDGEDGALAHDGDVGVRHRQQRVRRHVRSLRHPPRARAVQHAPLEGHSRQQAVERALPVRGHDRDAVAAVVRVAHLALRAPKKACQRWLDPRSRAWRLRNDARNLAPRRRAPRACWAAPGRCQSRSCLAPPGWPPPGRGWSRVTTQPDWHVKHEKRARNAAAAAYAMRGCVRRGASTQQQLPSAARVVCAGAARARARQRPRVLTHAQGGSTHLLHRVLRAPRTLARAPLRASGASRARPWASAARALSADVARAVAAHGAAGCLLLHDSCIAPRALTSVRTHAHVYTQLAASATP